MNTLPDRHNPAHPPPVARNGQPTVIHLTVCTRDRKPVLASSPVHQVLRESWQKASFWNVGVYVILPDHVHLFCIPAVYPPTDLRKWTQYWKSMAAKESPDLRGVWQPDCWDTQMRTLDQYTEKLAYVRQNPLRKGLVSNPADWPFAGELHVIRW